jgi:glycosyltransferase involved in cell wall biosynthesis
MRILTTLTYYVPHISGLTIYARRLIRRLVEAGHEVTVLTSHYDRGLPSREMIDGATVVRSPVLMRVSKGALMPLFPWQAARLMTSHDIVYLHLPQFEGSCVAALAKALKKPVVTSYQCDIELPPGLARLIFTPFIRLSHYVAGRLSDRIVVTSKDYGESSRLPRRFQEKVSSVYPPIELERTPVKTRTLRNRYDLGDGPLVGFLGRFAAEKGIEFLVNSMPLVFREVPNVRCVMAGLIDGVPGERVYERLRPRMEEMGSRIVHIGVLADEDLSEFYRTVDVFVLPSINSTESFGMTQAEAMLAGTPVVATDMPGVREAIRATGMGTLVPPRDEKALAQGIIAVLREPARYVRPEGQIRDLFDPENTAAFYQRLFAALVGNPEDTVKSGPADVAAIAPDEPDTSGAQDR